MSTYDDYLDTIDVLAGPGKPHVFEGTHVEDGMCAYAHWSANRDRAKRELVSCPQRATGHVRFDDGGEVFPLCDEHWVLSQSRADHIYDQHPVSEGCCEEIA